MKLNNKVAIVTGGGSGIGRGICLKFSKEGARVFVTDLVLDSAGLVAQEIKATGGEAWAVRADVTNLEDVNKSVAFAVAEAGGIEILVNCASAMRFRSLLDMKEAHWDGCVDSYLKGTFLYTQAVARQLVAQRRPGKIINIASINAFLPVPGLAAYCAAKAGVIMFTKVAALELARYGILVNAIAPGPVATPGTKGLFVDNERGREQFLAQMPIGRIGEPEDIARVALFLASPDSDFVTGHMLVADGGMSLIGEPSILDIVQQHKARRERAATLPLPLRPRHREL